MATIGPLSIISNPGDGQLQAVSIEGLPVGAHTGWEEASNQEHVSLAQLRGVTGDLDLGDLPGGSGIDEIALTGPVGVEANYADNSGALGGSSANVNDVQHVNLLENLAAHGLESLLISGPENVDVNWGADGEAIQLGEEPNANVLLGSVGGDLSSLVATGLLNSEFEWDDNTHLQHASIAGIDLLEGGPSELLGSLQSSLAGLPLDALSDNSIGGFDPLANLHS
jgi:hypothetical protein